MRFGFFAMPEHFPWENRTLAYDRDIARMVKAEQLGYEEFWIGEHHSGGYEPVPMPELMIAKASAVTSKILLGTGVINLPYHDPFLVAERMAFLDHLTHGRLLYGFGGGGLPSDRALLGLDAEEASPRMLEAIDVIERVLNAREPISHKGRFWQFDNRRLQVPPYQPQPQLAIAGLTGTHNFALCGEKGYIPLSVYFAPASIEDNPGVPDLIDHGKALDAGARKGGQDPALARQQWRITREVYVAESKAIALEEIREGVNKSYEYLLGLGLGALMKRNTTMNDAELSFQWMVENIPWIIGSPSDCVDQVQSLHEQTGGFGTLLINCRDWVSEDRFHRSMELFARQVIPAFREREHQNLRGALANDALGR